MRNGSTYKVLSTSDLETRQQAFLDDIKARAQKVACDYQQGDHESLIEPLSQYLLSAARIRVSPKAEELKRLVEKGVKYINKQTAVNEKKAKKDPWSWFLRRSLTKAFNARVEPPLVQNFFEAGDRIYIEVDSQALFGRTYEVVKNALDKNGYDIEDYVEGYAKSRADQQRYKIGKILQKSSEETALKYFQLDSARCTKPLFIVLSRNPKDIESVSTGRAWASCLNAKGLYRDKVPSLLESGALVAYLLHENDVEINDPLARVILKPYDCRESMKQRFAYERESGHTLEAYFNYRALLRTGVEEMDESSVIYLADEIHGLAPKQFQQIVQDFANEFLNSPVEGEYAHPGKVYRGALPQVIGVNKKGVMGLPAKLMK